MGIRITSVPNVETTTIHVEGRLDPTTLTDLLQEFQRTGTAVRLDLSGLLSVDAEGVRVLRSLAAEATELVGASPYVRQLLSTESS